MFAACMRCAHAVRMRRAHAACERCKRGACTRTSTPAPRRSSRAQHQKKPGRSRLLVRLAMPLIRSTLPSATPQLSAGGLAMSANSTSSARGKMSKERECTGRAVGCAAAAAAAAAATSSRAKTPEAAPQSMCVRGAGASSRSAAAAPASVWRIAATSASASCSAAARIASHVGVASSEIDASRSSSACCCSVLSRCAPPCFSTAVRFTPCAVGRDQRGADLSLRPPSPPPSPRIACSLVAAPVRFA